MQDKAQKAVIYLVGGLVAITVMVLIVNFIQRDPDQGRLTTIADNTQELIQLIDSVDSGDLNFSQRTWSATAAPALRTDVRILQDSGAEISVISDEVDTQEASVNQLIEQADSLLSENVTNYEQLSENHRESLKDVRDNQQLLLEEVRTISR